MAKTRASTTAAAGDTDENVKKEEQTATNGK